MLAHSVLQKLVSWSVVIDNISGKRFPPGQSGKFRHHSVDDDYYAYYNNPYSYYNGYGYPEKFGMHYGSQPSLLRSAGQRDSKYQHPHARYSGGQVRNDLSVKILKIRHTILRLLL